MSEERIKEGDIECHICGRDAEVRTSKKGKPYVICEHCGFQGFARMPEAAAGVRSKIKKPKEETNNGTKETENNNAPRVVRTVNHDEDDGLTGTGIV